MESKGSTAVKAESAAALDLLKSGLSKSEPVTGISGSTLEHTDHSGQAVSDVIVPRGDAQLKRPPSLQDQSSRMPLSKILLVYLSIGLALVVSLMDMTSVSTAAPSIGADLGGSDTIVWASTAFFISTGAMQMVYGRMSDIFGRKTLLQTAVFLLALGNLLCGFAKTPVQLYVFRAISGMGGGGVNGMAQVIICDIVPLHERGKYQGLVTAASALGSAVGPFLGGGLAADGNWRWIFWHVDRSRGTRLELTGVRITSIFGVLCIGLDQFILPLKPVTGSMLQKLSEVDYVGIVLSAASTVLLLVPVSGAGSTFAWDSSVVIGLLVAGAVSTILFVISQWKFAAFPVLPLHLFSNRTTAAVMLQSFLMGMIYFGNAFYIPQYFQLVKGYSSLVSGAFVLLYTFPQAFVGVGAGYYISRTNHYKRVIVLGAVLWTLGCGLQILWTAHTPTAQSVGCLEIGSLGIGMSLQTTLVAALATSHPRDRAVVTASRNFFRFIGGSFGLAVANAIYNNGLSAGLKSLDLMPNDQAGIMSSALHTLDSLSPAVRAAVRSVMADALRKVFIAFCAFGAACVVCSLVMEERTFARDTPELEAERRRNRGEKPVRAAEGRQQLEMQG